MCLAILLALTVFSLCGLVHLIVMSAVFSRVSNSTLTPSARMLIGFYCAGFAHLVEAGLYAVAFWLGRFWGLGDFKTVDGTIGPIET